MIRTVLVAIVAIGLTPALAQQPVPPSAAVTVVVRGRVVAEDGGAPLRRARIMVTPPDIEQPVFTDDRGAFELRVPAGSTHTIAVSKAGFVSRTATAVAPRTSQAREPALAIQLAKGGVITGRVVDTQGNPLVNIRVRAEREALSSERASVPQSTSTDDLGEYRLSGLVAGRYAVRLSTPQASEEVRIVPAQQAGTTPAGGGQALLEQLSRIRVADPAGTPPASRDGQAPAPGDVIVTVEAGRETRVVHDGVESPRHRVISVDPSTGAVTTVTTNDPVPRESIANIVTGRVVDESGEPVEGLVVDALRITNVSGMRGLQTSSLARQTDDRGQFRLFGIAPGSYYLEARGDANASTRYAGSFYPGRASLADAEPIVIEKGSELTGLDMVFRPSRPEPLRVSGTVVDAAGQAKLVGDVGMLLRHGAGLTGLGFDSRIEADGSFTIPNVPPGDYVLYAVGKGTSGERELGVTDVAVATNVGPVLIGTRRGTRMTGHVTFEGGMPAATPAKFGLAIAPADPAYAQMVTVYDGGFVGRDGNFEMTGLVGPGRLILAGAPEGWWIKSVLIGGRDIGTSPIPFGTAHLADVTVVVADGGARLTVPLGSDPNSRVQSIAVFPVDQNYWFVGSSRIRLLSRALTGRIGVTLPPGEYWVTTVETSYADEAFGTWGAESLGTLAAGAKRITLVEGQTTVVEMERRRAN